MAACLLCSLMAHGPMLRMPRAAPLMPAGVAVPWTGPAAAEVAAASRQAGTRTTPHTPHPSLMSLAAAAAPWTSSSPGTRTTPHRTHLSSRTCPNPHPPSTLHCSRLPPRITGPPHHPRGPFLGLRARVGMSGCSGSPTTLRAGEEAPTCRAKLTTRTSTRARTRIRARTKTRATRQMAVVCLRMPPTTL